VSEYLDCNAVNYNEQVNSRNIALSALESETGTNLQSTETMHSTAYTAGNLDLAVDALAALLKDFGQNAFDMPTMAAATLNARCEAWAKHILFATVPPDHKTTARSARASSSEAFLADLPSEALYLSGGKRDWNSLRLFFQQHRRLEKEYVQTSLNDLRNVIWTCVREFDQSSQSETQTDHRMKNQMERLQSVLLSNDLEEMKHAVISTITSINQMMEQQRQQQKTRMEGLHSRIRELDFLLAQARKENSLDALTNLFNRKAFAEQLAHTLNLVNVFGESACLFLVDADHFKAINDTYGHSAGDTTLCALADCLSRLFSGRNDCVARYGGEEFVIICQEMSLSEGHRQAERLLEAVRALPIHHTGLAKEIRVTVSIGLSEAHVSDNVTTWIDRTDQALYRAKQGGRDRLETN